MKMVGYLFFLLCFLSENLLPASKRPAVYSSEEKVLIISYLESEFEKMSEKQMRHINFLLDTLIHMINHTNINHSRRVISKEDFSWPLLKTALKDCIAVTEKIGTVFDSFCDNHLSYAIRTIIEEYIKIEERKDSIIWDAAHIFALQLWLAAIDEFFAIDVCAFFAKQAIIERNTNPETGVTFIEVDFIHPNNWFLGNISKLYEISHKDPFILDGGLALS